MNFISKGQNTKKSVNLVALKHINHTTVNEEP